VRFGATFVIKVNVNPTGKKILSIPFGFSVAQKDQGVDGFTHMRILPDRL
jgi:hypothetical protein